MESGNKITDQFEKDYEAWFLENVESLKIPPWSSIGGNIYWIRWTYDFAQILFEFLNNKFGYQQQIKVLDAGAGKGFLSFLLSKRANTEVHAVDIETNPFFTAFQKERNIPVKYQSIQNDHIPYPTMTFDLVLLIEVIEHVAKPKHVMKECLDILKPGGFLIITTPPRFKFLFRRDPHFRLKYLYLLPLFVQNFIVEKILKYPRIEGYLDYKVHQIFWNVHQFSALCKSTGYKTKISVEPAGSLFTWRRIVIEKLANNHSDK